MLSIMLMREETAVVLSFPLHFFQICENLSQGVAQKYIAKERDGHLLHIFLCKFAEKFQCILSSTNSGASQQPQANMAYDIISLDPYNHENIGDCEQWNSLSCSKRSKATTQSTDCDTEPASLANGCVQFMIEDTAAVENTERCKIPCKEEVVALEEIACSEKKDSEILGDTKELTVNENNRSNSTDVVRKLRKVKRKNDSSMNNTKSARTSVRTRKTENVSGVKREVAYKNLEENDVCDLKGGNVASEKVKGNSCPCIKCGKIYSTVKHMEQHVRLFHKNDADFRRLMQKIEADRNDRSKRQSQVAVQCPMCGEERRGRRIFTHMKQAHGQEPRYSQHLVSVRAQHRDQLLQHRRALAQKDAQIRQACHFCGKMYTKTCIRQHIKYQCASNPDRQAMKHCTQCGFHTLYPNVLESHVADKHADNYKIVCDICGHVARSKSVFFNHRRKVHNLKGKNAKEHACGICGRECYSEGKLQTHMTSHSDVRNIACSACGKQFKTEANLKKHVRAAHDNIFPYHCERCGHGVAKQSYLETHRCDRVRRNQQQTNDVSSQHSKPGNPSQEHATNTDNVLLDNSAYQGNAADCSQISGNVNSTAETISESEEGGSVYREVRSTTGNDFSHQSSVVAVKQMDVGESEFVIEEDPVTANAEVIYLQVEGNAETIYAEDGTELVFVYDDASVEIT